LTNTRQLQKEMFRQDFRHVNTNSDSEVLLNVLAHELQQATRDFHLDPETIFKAVTALHRRCKGAYAVVVLIAGHGLLAFRDPHGIRPLVMGMHRLDDGRSEYLVASESVALDTLGFNVLRDVAPGEAVFIDMKHELHTRQCAEGGVSAPCIFEYVYLARPDSVIDGVSVYEARLRMGEHLAVAVKKQVSVEEIDVVIPIPDSSRPSAMQLAECLKIPEGFVKNRYITRTFIKPDQATRKSDVLLKLNPIKDYVRGKRVCLVDDSLVRGTTMKILVKALRDAGAIEVHIRICSPPFLWPCFFGTNICDREQLVAANQTAEQTAQSLGADSLNYLRVERLDEVLPDMKKPGFCNACFTGKYPV
jgi:amidophosphoribosyltransferase